PSRSWWRSCSRPSSCSRPTGPSRWAPVRATPPPWPAGSSPPSTPSTAAPTWLARRPPAAPPPSPPTGPCHCAHARPAAPPAPPPAALGYRNVAVHVGDGTLGWPAGAPYAAILVPPAGRELPPALAEQLAVGGRLVVPLGPAGEQRLVRMRRSGPDQWRSE